jgi:putative iron-only hydrogenase system regulator
MPAEDRLGFVGLVVEDRAQVARMNEILSDFGDMIRGRIGVPDRETGIGVIGLIVEGSNERIGAMTGRLGNLKGVQVKSALTTKTRKTAENGGEP